MSVNGFGHIACFCRLQKTDQSFRWRVLMMMAGVTGIRLSLHATYLYGVLRIHEFEGVAVGVAGLTNAGHFRHVTADTAAKGVDPVDRSVLWRRVAALAKLVLKQTGLGTDNDQWVGHLAAGLQGALAAVDIVAGDTGYTHLCVFTLLPVEILLVAVPGFP